jgi:phosphatidylserine decarboxylase
MEGLRLDTRKVNNKLPIAWEGIPFVLAGVTLTALFFLLDLQFLAIALALLTLFTAYFFRDPDRNLVDREKAVLTPADGKIIAIRNLETGDNRLKDKSIKISIFMSVFNAHINRIPVTGRVSRLAYHPGRFFSANLDKASLHNENNVVTLETDNRKRIILVQIAGLIARRIVCWLKTGDYVYTGQRFGLIRFGSRLEVYLPPDTAILVSIGQKVKAGQTVLGYLS